MAGGNLPSDRHGFKAFGNFLRRDVTLKKARPAD
jgi:hypothetical protein